jgi:hypothetical protein
MIQKRIFIFCFLFSAFAGYSQNISEIHPLPGFKGIRGKIYDAKTGRALPSRIEVYNESKELQETYYRHLPGIFTEEDGSFHVPLSPGKYTVKVSHSTDYISHEHAFEVTRTTGAAANIYLAPWVPLRAMGWINGEAHAHLYTDKKPDTEMLAEVRKICLAQGIDFICSVQGWAGVDDNTWKKNYAAISDRDFAMYYGAEMPKYRTGHTFWIGLQSTKDFFWNAMDTVYENLYYQSSTAAHWNFSTVDLPNFPDVELVPRLAMTQNAAAIIAHPTRWWMEQRGAISKYTTNSAVNMAFNLLSGNLWDGIVVMGDDKDHYSYQNFWFNILNLGYRMPAISELDGGNTREHKFPYGLMRTFFQIDTTNSNTAQALVDAVHHGKTFVTSGPVVLTNIDEKFTIGDVIASDARTHVLHVKAYASGDALDFLSYVIIFRNGKIWKCWDLREKAPRTFTEDIPITETQQAWYIIKAYGKNSWKDPGNLDVMSWLEKPVKEPAEDRDVCITSPYYFLPEGMAAPAPMMSDVSLTVRSPSNKKPVKNGTLDIFHLGKKIRSQNLINGKAHFSMPVNAVVKITVQGYADIHRSLYLDFKPHLKLLETLSNGDWREKPEFKGKVYPGYIPWKAFQVEETRKLLRHVDWEITIEPNARDRQWEKFEQIFSTGK